MVGDQELDCIALFRREAEPLEHVARHAHALEVMVVVPPLADVVQEQGEHQQFRRGEIPEQ